MALTAPTDFVWLVDDDMIPGKKYLGQLMHAAGTDLLGNSLLGSIGRVLPRPGRDMSLVSYRKVGGCEKPRALNCASLFLGHAFLCLSLLFILAFLLVLSVVFGSRRLA